MRITTRWQPQQALEEEEDTVSSNSRHFYNNMHNNNSNTMRGGSGDHIKHHQQKPRPAVAPLAVPASVPSSSASMTPVSPPSITSSPSATSTKQTMESYTHVWVKPAAAVASSATANNTGSICSSNKRSSLLGSRRLSSNSSGLGGDGDGTHLLQGGRAPWAWKKGLLLEQTKQELVVRLLDDDNDEAAINNTTTLSFPADDALGSTVLLTNDFAVDEATGTILPPDDLITLTHLNEPAVLVSLQARYYQDKIYTNTGAVLLAVNPFCAVRGLYGETAMKLYWQRAEAGHGVPPPPHVYGIADASFRSMMRQLEQQDSSGAHQSILVSGESGAGKTVTTKFVMKYLAALSQRRSMQKQEPQERAFRKAAAATLNSKRKNSSPFKKKQQSGGQNQDNTNLTSLTLLSGGNTSIEGQVLQSNPILESFGNARTVRNDNSSRFGKFIEIQFSESGQLVGASIETYLLEKVRLVHQSVGERNYHIFYELLSGGMDARQLSHYFIAKTAQPEDFKLTASGTYDRRDGVSDQDTYKALRHACAAMKFDNADLHAVFCVTAALLHASNLTLVEDTSSGDENSWLDLDNVHLMPVCHLLGVTAEDLELALCQQTLTAGRNQTVTKRLGLEKAIKGLEALLKAIYGALFEYLVHRINDSVAYKDNEHDSDDEDDHSDGFRFRASRAPVASVRVLDIFGFESFYINSFEQLCINYCNEALQQQFNAFVLRNEQSEYEREGIDWSFIAFEENQDVLDLIEQRNKGILSLLDDQCRAPGPSDKAFWLQVTKQCAQHSRFSVSRLQEAHQQFSIQHYAGQVEYTTYGFVEKNRDELSREGTELVKNSQNPLVRELARIMQEESLCEAPPLLSPAHSASPLASPRTSGLRRLDSSVGRATVGGQFRRQLKHLRTKIDETTPHYIRCLKPNDMLVAGHFDTAVVAEQLRCGGILEAVRVARAGFTQHYLHADFVRRYRTLAWREMANTTASTATIMTTGSSNSGRRGPRGMLPSTPKKALAIEQDEKAQCKDLIRILYRKMQEHENAVDTATIQECGSLFSFAMSSDWEDRGSPAKARSYSYISSAPRPPWSKTPSPRHNSRGSSPSTKHGKRGGALLSTFDYAKVGIQLGKTKVFLRHKAFEVLERIRSRMQTSAATQLNAIFRMYLARIAYIPYRDAFRRELAQKKLRGDRADESKEAKEEYDDDEHKDDGYFDDSKSTFLRFRKAMRNPEIPESLVNKWEESKIRDAIHNPVPRHEWGKAAPSKAASFKWVLSEGLWVRSF